MPFDPATGDIYMKVCDCKECLEERHMLLIERNPLVGYMWTALCLEKNEYYGLYDEELFEHYKKVA